MTVLHFLLIIEPADITYFDFAKSFDSVKHDQILHKLKDQFHIDVFYLPL